MELNFKFIHNTARFEIMTNIYWVLLTSQMMIQIKDTRGNLEYKIKQLSEET